MLALTTHPAKASSARVREVPEPAAADGPVLVRTLAVGVCGTDREIVRGSYGVAPPGERHLVLGHESLGEVLEAPGDSGLSPGDRVVGIVRRPDPVPCSSCAVGEWDMCKNGLYTERGIKGRHGYCSERYRIHPQFAVRVPTALGLAGVLLEPTSVVAKAWDHIDKIGARAHFAPRRALVTGAGPIGLLAAMLGVQRGLDVHVLDRVSDGPKPELVRALGASYHTSSVADACGGADVVVECTGIGSLVLDVMEHNASDGIVCLTGISSGGRAIQLDASALNRKLVLENDVVFGSVNANRRHYELAAEALARADADWLGRLITRRTTLERFAEALDGDPARDVKSVIVLG